MTIAILILAALVLVFILRAEGDEVIGFGGTLEINDGVADAFVAVPKIVTLDVPDTAVTIIESRRLDLADATIKKLAGLKNGGSFTFQVQVIAATRTRILAIKDERLEKQYRVSVPVDTGTYQVTVPGIIETAPIETLEAEKITVMNVTVAVSGAKIEDEVVVTP